MAIPHGAGRISHQTPNPILTSLQWKPTNKKHKRAAGGREVEGGVRM